MVFYVDHKALHGVKNGKNQISSENSCEKKALCGSFYGKHFVAHSKYQKVLCALIYGAVRKSAGSTCLGVQ